MRRLLGWALILLVVIVIAAAGGWWGAMKSRPRPPEPPSVLTQIRETMKLETLEVSLYKKVDFRPERMPAETAWKEAIAWMREALVDPRGRAIVFATVRLGYDLSRIETSSLRIQGDRVEFVLPPVQSVVELLPDETEVINSNLDSKETAQLLEHARKAFKLQVEQDLRLKARARISAERALKALLYQVGFRDVRVVDVLSPAGQG